MTSKLTSDGRQRWQQTDHRDARRSLQPGHQRPAHRRQGIGDELEQVVASAAFRSAPRLAAFLRFVVEMTLAGQSDRIKGYTIGVEALGRDESFDPQTDPIVRVEAGRLRRALARHYAGAGRNDAVVIELPLGRYVPAFHRPQRGRAASTAPARIRDDARQQECAALAPLLVRRSRSTSSRSNAMGPRRA